MTRFIIPILLFSVSGMLYFGYTAKLLEDIKGIKSEIALRDDALTNAKELRALRDKLIAKENTISEQDREKLSSFLPNHIDNVRLIIDLDNIAAQYGMSLRNIRISTSDGSTGNSNSSGKKYGQLSFGFSVSGSYDLFLRFLSDLERSLRLVDITSISFASSDKDFQDYSVDLVTYWYK